MDAVGAGGKRHLRPVVDDERNAERRETRHEGAGDADQFVVGRVLVAELDDGDTALDRREHGLDQTAARRHRPVGDEHQCEFFPLHAHLTPAARPASSSR